MPKKIGETGKLQSFFPEISRYPDSVFALFFEGAAMVCVFEKSRRTVAGLCITSMLSACVTDAPRPETATVVAAVKTPVT
ncbi:MAG: hypothetical protein WAZ34_11660, partial [Rhodocyclaceae bacterium]